MAAFLGVGVHRGVAADLLVIDKIDSAISTGFLTKILSGRGRGSGGFSGRGGGGAKRW